MEEIDYKERLAHVSLFSGIGGFDLAAEWAGWENKFHCEINEFGRRVLNYYWPEAASYGDITKTDFTIYRGRIDVLTGGFPCQPYSVAGKRLGKEDERHLWPEMLRAIREIKPRWVVGENVSGIISWNGGLVFNEVQTDLEAEGYEVQPFLLPAAGVNAPHRRDRVWFVAYRGCKFSREGSEKEPERTPHNNQRRSICEVEGGEKGSYKCRTIADTRNKGFQGGKETGNITEGREKRDKQPSGLFFTDWQNFPTQHPVCGGNDGISGKLDFNAIFRQLGIEHSRKPAIGFSKWRKESIKAYGNAIVPQVAFQIFKAINKYEELYNGRN